MFFNIKRRSHTMHDLINVAWAYSFIVPSLQHLLWCPWAGHAMYRELTRETFVANFRWNQLEWGWFLDDWWKTRSVKRNRVEYNTQNTTRCAPKDIVYTPALQRKKWVKEKKSSWWLLLFVWALSNLDGLRHPWTLYVVDKKIPRIITLNTRCL